MTDKLSPEAARDRWHREQFGVPDRDWKAFQAQRYSARRRGIPFLFSLLAWSSWWKVQLRAIGPDATRGRKRDQYVMARLGDRGAYEVGNVYCATSAQNIRDIPEDVRVVMTERCTASRARNGHPRGVHLKVRGDSHPRSKAVVTPLGRFGSIALASEAHGFSRQAGHYAVKRGAWSIEA